MHPQGANTRNIRYMHSGGILRYKTATPCLPTCFGPKLHSPPTVGHTIKRLASLARTYSTSAGFVERMPSFAFAFEWVDTHKSSY